MEVKAETRTVYIVDGEEYATRVTAERGEWITEDME